MSRARHCRPRLASIVVAWVAVAAPGALVAQHAGHGVSLPAAATDPYPGLGDLSFPITTASPEAQTFFDYGIGLLYGFNHDEAARYFRRAAELDPQAAMPYWGLALAIGPNYNDTVVDEARARATYEAVQNAAQRVGGGSKLEQAYVAALARRYPSPDPASDWLGFHRDYSVAMRELSARFPDDLDAATLFAESLMMLRPWQLWTAAGEPAPGTLELVAVLESVLKRNPNHPGANHFYIHAVEASRNLERAIPSATRLMTLAPAAGHLVHMPGHIFLQTGDFELAAATNVKAAAADKAFVARTGASGVYPLMYWTHNLHFIAYARAQQGRYAEALQAAREMVANVGEADAQMQMLEAFKLYPLMIELRFKAWDAILAEAEPEKERAFTHAFWRHARALAWVGKGRLREAGAEQRRFERERAAVPVEARYLQNNTAADLLTLAAAIFDAEIAEARGDAPGSLAAWQRALAAEAALQYDEPPAWFYPIRQSLGAALLRAGQAAEAERVFREALDRAPRDGRLLFGLWQSLEALGRTSEARLVESQHREAWRDATESLTLASL
jgi:Flp pilus assembly protein TadD